MLRDEDIAANKLASFLEPCCISKEIDSTDTFRS
jgi:hypothetical protein